MWMLLHPLVWSNTAIVSSLGPSQLLSPVGWVPLYLSSALSGRQLRPVSPSGHLPRSELSSHQPLTQQVSQEHHTLHLSLGHWSVRPVEGQQFFILEMFEQTLSREGRGRRRRGEGEGQQFCLLSSGQFVTFCWLSPPPLPPPSSPSLLSPLLYCPATNKIIKNIRRIRIEFLEKIWEKCGIISCALRSKAPVFATLLGRIDLKSIYNIVSLIITSHRSLFLSTTIKYCTAIISRNFPDR